MLYFRIIHALNDVFGSSFPPRFFIHCNCFMNLSFKFPWTLCIQCIEGVSTNSDIHSIIICWHVQIRYVHSMFVIFYLPLPLFLSFFGKTHSPKAIYSDEKIMFHRFRCWLRIMSHLCHSLNFCCYLPTNRLRGGAHTRTQTHVCRSKHSYTFAYTFTQYIAWINHIFSSNFIESST